jgi:hypothetical protein
MEANLDEEYYEKYLQYKQKYLMLKQLKNNNNDLEGGGSWFSSLFGSKEEEAPAPAPDAAPVPDANPAPDASNGTTDGTYLVFFIDEMKYNNYEQVKVFIQDYWNEIPVKDGHNFYKKKAFQNDYHENAYIVKKQGNIYTYKIISNIFNESNFDDEFTQITNLKESLENIKTTTNCTCEIPKTNLIENENFQINLIKDKYNVISKLYEILSDDYNKAIGFLNTTFGNTIEDIKKKIESFENEDQIIKYKTNTMDTFSSEVFNIDTIPTFFNSFKNKTTKEMNMIIKIQDNDNEDEYRFNGTILDKSVSRTKMYEDIGIKVSTNRAALNSMHNTMQNATGLRINSSQNMGMSGMAPGMAPSYMAPGMTSSYMAPGMALGMAPGMASGMASSMGMPVGTSTSYIAPGIGSPSPSMYSMSMPGSTIMSFQPQNMYSNSQGSPQAVVMSGLPPVQYRY